MSKKSNTESQADGILRVVPLGGLGEIGKNMMIMEYVTETNHDSIIIDAGIMFPESDMHGVDLIIPDFDYIMDRLDTIRGVIITHGHEDHTGSIAYVMEHVKAPVYATGLTRALLELKLKAKNLLEQTQMVTAQAGDTYKMGPFIVELFHVCHSIPDSVGVAVTTPVGLVVHTGDYKFDNSPVDGWPTDFGALANFGKRGVLALFGDSTNSTVAGWTRTETEISPVFDEIFFDAPGRIIVATFASLISRVQQVANTAARHNRKLVVTGYSMVQNVRLARELGYLDIPDEMMVDISEMGNYKPEQIVVMTTGTQGEPLAGLGRLSTGKHRHLDVLDDDIVLMSSHPIPGNEEGVSRVINKLIQRGANVIYDPIEAVHVSGHAAAEEIKLMINLIKPKFLVPVHGELRHLHQHARMGKRLGIPAENVAVVENGTILTFTADSMEIGERIPGGYVFVDGSGVGDIGPAVLRERETLGRAGIVIVNVTISRDTRELIGIPEFITRGFVYVREAEELIDHSIKLTTDIIERDAKHTSARQLQNVINDALNKYFYTETKRHPIIFVFVIEG